MVQLVKYGIEIEATKNDEGFIDYTIKPPPSYETIESLDPGGSPSKYSHFHPRQHHRNHQRDNRYSTRQISDQPPE